MAPLTRAQIAHLLDTGRLPMRTPPTRLRLAAATVVLVAFTVLGSLAAAPHVLPMWAN